MQPDRNLVGTMSLTLMKNLAGVVTLVYISIIPELRQENFHEV